MQAYGQSKLANLIFSLELHRRSGTENWGVMSIAAHPGLSRTDLPAASGTGENRMPLIARLIAQPAAQGALPILFAATSSEALSGQYYGPGGFNETKGFPASAKISPQAKDENTTKQLWEISKQLTNVDFDMIASTQI
jgi:NAD(P)-dependent dehydrogenase (short-subunit alcohol dehydrogenase family)